jgi:hypothetical protein
MSNGTASDHEHAAELMAQIEDRYLLLIRENYLDAPTGGALRDFLVSSLRGLLHTGRFSCVYDLACSRDWREAVVGLHYAVILACPAFDLSRQGRPEPKAYQLLSGKIGDKFESDLRNGTALAQPLSARPAFLLFTLLNRRGCILDFLATATQPGDSTGVYAAALVSEELTRSGPGIEGQPPDHKTVELRERVLNLLRSEPWHDDDEFVGSQQRFRQSWWYWTKLGQR